MKKSLLIIVSLGLVLGLAACDVSLAGDVTPPPGARMPEVQPTQAVVEEAAMPEGINLQAGANWYVEKCLDCHGPQGLGDGNQAGALGVLIPPIGVMEQAYLASPLEWFNVVRDGRMALMMPPFSGSLSDQDIWDVLGYVYGLGTDPALIAEGEAIFGETCAACHGAEGEGGAASGAPSLQDAERTTSLSLAEIAHKIATGSGNEAHAFANQLDNDQQQAAALFVRSFLFGIIDPELVVEEPVDQDSTDAGEAETAVPGEDPAEVEEPISVVPGTGNVVSGNVVNKSGTGISEGLQVSLQGYLNYELVLDLTAPVAEDGSFVIEDVVFEAETIYIAVVEYQDMFYPSDFYMAEGGDEGVVFEVEIYDSTTDTSALEVSRMHIFFEWITPESVQVVHMVTVSNLGTETVFAPGENEPVLEFSIPDQATNLLFETGAVGDPYLGTDSGFGDPRPVSPGEGAYEVLFAYQMAYDKGMTWTLPIDLPTRFTAVFVQGDNLTLESADLAPVANQEVQGSIYKSMSASSLAAGDQITLEISGKATMPDTPGEEETNSNLMVIGIGSFGLLLIGLGVWWYFRPASADLDALDGLDSEALIEEIAALDDAFEAGEIGQADYQRERTILKSELRKMLDNE